MWTNKYKISFNTYLYCRDIEDNPEIRKFIITPHWAHCYCKYIREDPKVRKYAKFEYKRITEE